ncbi:hypothetical protein ACLOJK_033339 [Asimina triloba]
MESNRKATQYVAPASPRLQRSRSSAPAIHRTSTPEAHPLASNSSKNLIPRSNSTSKARPSKLKQVADENRIPKAGKPSDIRDNLAGAFHRHRISDAATEAAKPKKMRPSAGSPSAWALSPGRSPAMERPEKQRNGVGGVGSVLRLFRQKKVPSGKEVAAHQLRMLQTRWMQWRFVNARAEAAMAAGKSTAEVRHRNPPSRIPKPPLARTTRAFGVLCPLSCYVAMLAHKQVFNVWSENNELRSWVTEKCIQILRLKAEIKLQKIVKSQMPALNQWERIEKRNLEAVTRTAGILRLAASKVPLVLGAKVDMFSVHETICAAMDVMEGIEATISKFFKQVESTSTLLTELEKVVKQERESLGELMNISVTIASLEVGFVIYEKYKDV